MRLEHSEVHTENIQKDMPWICCWTMNLRATVSDIQGDIN